MHDNQGEDEAQKNSHLVSISLTEVNYFFATVSPLHPTVAPFLTRSFVFYVIHIVHCATSPPVIVHLNHKCLV